MTKEEAKLVLDNARPQTKEIDRQFYDDEDLNNALDMAIKALEQQPSDDCVSRAEVLETIEDCNSDGLKGIFCSYDDGERFKEYIKKLPPVTPTFPKGVTNGGVIKAMFPDLVNSNMDLVDVLNNAKSWWNALYKGVEHDI